jgi:hypothetical protein
MPTGSNWGSETGKAFKKYNLNDISNGNISKAIRSYAGDFKKSKKWVVARMMRDRGVTCP